MNIKTFKLGSRTYGFVDGGDKVIITEDDCYHFISDKKEFELSAGWQPTGEKSPEGGDYLAEKFQIVKLEDIRQIAKDIEVSKFVDYWGIKSRIWDNYVSFLSSMREIGVSTDSMPKWGEKCIRLALNEN